MESCIKLHDLYMLVGDLKRLKRTGWVLCGVGDGYPESVADHMYRMGFMAMTLPLKDFEDSAGLEGDRVVKLCLVHDVAEAIVGDLIVGRDGVTKKNKHQLESDAIEKMKTDLDPHTAKMFQDLWLEYENQTSSEAELAKDLDKYDMILQAHDYEIRDKCPGKLQQFFDSTEGSFKYTCVKNLVQVLYDKRKKWIESSEAVQS